MDTDPTMAQEPNIYLMDRARRLLIKRLNSKYGQCGYDLNTDLSMILHFLGRAESLSQQQLADAMDKHKGTLSPQLDALENLGLINRCPGQRDRRQKLISLTPQGDRMRRTLAPIDQHYVRQAQEGLTARELAVCRRVLIKICDNLRAITPEA